MVLSLYPSNTSARFDMGVLEQEAGRTNEAILLYQGGAAEGSELLTR